MEIYNENPEVDSMHKIKAETGLANIAGKYINEYRLSHNMSLRDMAELLQKKGLDWDKNAVSRAEQGRRTIIDVEVVKLAEVMGVSCDEILDLRIPES